MMWCKNKAEGYTVLSTCYKKQCEKCRLIILKGTIKKRLNK